MKRRGFIQKAAAGLALLTIAPTLLKSEGKPVFKVINGEPYPDDMLISKEGYAFMYTGDNNYVPIDGSDIEAKEYELYQIANCLPEA